MDVATAAGVRRPPREVVAVAAFAAGYGLAAAAALALPVPARGWGVLALSAGGCAGMVLLARWLGRDDVSAALAVLLPVSVFQVLPDWYLAASVGSLSFPDTGGVRVGGAIPLAMAGMWALPLLVVVLLARGSATRGAVASLAVFLVAELAAPVLALWEPSGGVRELLGVALYVLPAEAALGAAAVVAVRAGRHADAGTRLALAAAVSVFYTGALALSYFLLEVAELGLSA